MDSYAVHGRERTQVAVNSFIRSTYNWMALGLGLTGLVALFTANSPPLLRFIFGNSFVFYGLIIAELALVFILSSRVSKMEPGTATAMFLGYAALNGLTLSAIFLVFAAATVASAFFISAVTFVACSVYGYVTKRDLTGWGSFLFMGLIGIIIASLVNLFMQSSAVQMIINYIGVFIFIGLTAYDTQKLKHMALSQPEGLDAGVIRKGAIMGALSLYLDFINMFLFILYILGGARD